MAAVFEAQKKLLTNTGWRSRLLRLVSGFCFLALLPFTPLSLLAQGGPPLLTDDPGTPGRNNWEINFGFTIDRQPDDNDYETPILDMNYGWGDRVQLKYEMPYVYNSMAKRPLLSGPGDSKFGVKVRFFQDEKLSLNISTYPQLEVNNTSNSVRRGLVFNGPLFLLPLEVTKKVGPIDVDLEVGHWFTQQQGYWISGLAFGHQATRRLEVLGEVYSNSTPVGERDNTFDFGGRYRLNQNALFIFMAGRSFSPPRSGQSQLIGYFGMQFQLGRHLREEEAETHSPAASIGINR